MKYPSRLLNLTNFTQVSYSFETKQHKKKIKIITITQGKLNLLHKYFE